MSFHQKASLLLGATLIALFVLLGFLGLRALNDSTRRVFQERVIIARMVASRVDQALEEARDYMEQAAASIERGGDPLAILSGIYGYSPFFTMVFYSDGSGRVYVFPTSRKLPAGLEKHPAWQKAIMLGATQISGDVTLEPASPPTFGIFVPVSDGRGRSRGVVGGALDLDRIGARELGIIQLGETAFAEIVNEKGMVMVSTLKPERPGIRTEYAEHFAFLIKRGEAAPEKCYRCHETAEGIERERDVLAFAPLKTVPGGVAVRQKEKIALLPTQRLKRDMLIVGIPIFVLGILFTWLGSRRLVKPLASLTTAAQRIARGELDTPLALDRNDEIGLLSRSFEEMRLKLKAFLEEKETRARESESRAQQLSILNSLANSLGQSLELETLLHRALEKVLEILKLESGAIFLAEDGELKLESHLGGDREVMENIARLGWGMGPTTLIFPLSKDTPLSFVYLPLISKERPLGCLVLSAPEISLSHHDRELLNAIGHQIALSVDNARLFREARKREEEARALYYIGSELSRLLDLDRILDTVVDCARRLLEADVAFLSLIEEDSEEIYVRATAGDFPGGIRNIKLKPGQGVAGKVIGEGRPLNITDYLGEVSFEHHPEADALVREAGLKAHLAVPLKIGEQIIGALTVARRKARPFPERGLDLLRQLASQAAIAIENSRLYEQVQDIAVLQERDRIAREMHDGLSQTLSCLLLETRRVKDLIARGEREAAVEGMEELIDITRSAYQEVRQSIGELRLQPEIQRGFIPALQEYVRRFETQTGIPVKLVVGDAQASRLSSRAAVQVMRILQEALANIRKHSRANRAEVRFDVEDGGVRITIEDDGVGFDPTPYLDGDRDHFGLSTMRERAQSLGGSLEISSAPGQGTRLTIHLPAQS